MNSNHYSPNNMLNQNRFNLRTSSESNRRYKSMDGQLPSWQSPPWLPRQQTFVPPGGFNSGPRRGNWHNNNRRYSNSPNNSSYHSYKSFNDTSTPQQRRRSGGSRFNSPNNSGVMSISFSPYRGRRACPYSRNYSRGRRSYDRPNTMSSQDQHKPPVQVYFKPSMLEDPWSNFSSPNAMKTGTTTNQDSTSQRYFANSSVAAE